MKLKTPRYQVSSFKKIVIFLGSSTRSKMCGLGLLEIEVLRFVCFKDFKFQICNQVFACLYSSRYIACSSVATCAEFGSHLTACTTGPVANFVWSAIFNVHSIMRSSSPA